MTGRVRRQGELRAAVIDAARRGLTIAEAAAELEVAGGTVQSTAWRLRKRGFDLPPFRVDPQFRQPPHLPKGTPAEPREGGGIDDARAAVVHLRQIGLTEAEVADELGLDPARVARILRERRLRLALRAERRWLALTRREVGDVAGVTRSVVRDLEDGASRTHLRAALRAIASMRESRLREIAEMLSDRGAVVPHVLDVDGPEVLDQALDNLRALRQIDGAPLTLREREVLRLWSSDDVTQVEVAEWVGVSRARVGQVIERAGELIRRWVARPTKPIAGAVSPEALARAGITLLPPPRLGPVPRKPRKRIGRRATGRVYRPLVWPQVGEVWRRRSGDSRAWRVTYVGARSPMGPVSVYLVRDDDPSVERRASVHTFASTWVKRPGPPGAADSALCGVTYPIHDHDMATTHKTDPDARQTPDDKIRDNPQSERARPGDAPAKDPDVLERERVQVPPGVQGPTNERPHAPTPTAPVPGPAAQRTPDRTNLVGRE